MATQWMRWNETTHIFEYSTDGGSTYVPLPLNASILTEGTLRPGIGGISNPTTIAGTIPTLILSFTGSVSKGRLTQPQGTQTVVAANLSFDGTNWNRDDTTVAAASLLVGAGGNLVYSSVAAGANPAVMAAVVTFNLVGSTVNSPFTISDTGPGLVLTTAGNVRKVHLSAIANTGTFGHNLYYTGSAWVQDDASQIGTMLHMNSGWYFYHIPAGGGLTLSGTLTTAGALSIPGSINCGAIVCTNISPSGIVQSTGVIYPGRIDVTGAQGSWYLAGHGSYGLYCNTGFYVAGQIWSAGEVCSGPISCTNITPSGTIYANNIGSAAANVTITLAADGYLRRATSSERFKEDIRRGWKNPQRAALLGISPILYTAKEDVEKKSGDYLGFSAEELDAAGLRLWVNYEADGKTPFSVREHAFLASFLDLLKDHERRIAALEG